MDHLLLTNVVGVKTLTIFMVPMDLMVCIHKSFGLYTMETEMVLSLGMMMGQFILKDQIIVEEAIGELVEIGIPILMVLPHLPVQLN